MLPVTGRLLKSFNFAFQPRSHAVDLVQALHVILRMLDRLNTTGTFACLAVLLLMLVTPAVANMITIGRLDCIYTLGPS